MSARISELEEAAEQARSRAAKLEKERNRLQIEIREVVTELEEVRYITNSNFITSFNKTDVFKFNLFLTFWRHWSTNIKLCSQWRIQNFIMGADGRGERSGEGAVPPPRKN